MVDLAGVPLPRQVTIRHMGAVSEAPGHVRLTLTRVVETSREEFAPMFEATAMLPLPAQHLERGRAALCLLPLGPAALALAPGLARSALRPGVLAAYAVALCGACAVEVFSRPPREPSDKAARWLFSLVLCLALASEVAR